MTAQEAITYIENYSWSTTRLGLDRTKALLAAIGQHPLKIATSHIGAADELGTVNKDVAAIIGWQVGRGHY